ncbi:hypothetical protein V1478_003730 [Vespula squamosa]|uniref:Uncharacterized protein n=1 Tax=Vespula squamosa TaxID=30214 RepID=A0ABD2BMP4_VESSQ
MDSVLVIYVPAQTHLIYSAEHNSLTLFREKCSYILDVESSNHMAENKEEMEHRWFRHIVFPFSVAADEKYGRFFLSVNRENHALGCSQHREYVARRPFALAQTAWHKSHEFTSSVKKSKPIFIVVSGAVTYNKLNFYINILIIDIDLLPIHINAADIAVLRPTHVPVFIHIDGTRLKHKPDMQTTIGTLSLLERQTEANVLLEHCLRAVCLLNICYVVCQRITFEGADCEKAVIIRLPAVLVACSTRRYIVAWVGPKRAARGTGRGTGLSTASFHVVVALLLVLHDEEERKRRTTGHGMRIDEIQGRARGSSPFVCPILARICTEHTNVHGIFLVPFRHTAFGGSMDHGTGLLLVVELKSMISIHDSLAVDIGIARRLARSQSNVVEAEDKQHGCRNYEELDDTE